MAANQATTWRLCIRINLYLYLYHRLEVVVAGARQAATWRNVKSAVPSSRQVEDYQEAAK